MLYKNAKALQEALNPIEDLTYNSRVDGNGNYYSEVVDDGGDVLFSSTYVQGQDTMTVTDNRTGLVKAEPISHSFSLSGVEDDMRELGYITKRQRLVIGDVAFAL
jgi:hypothetical protein